MIDYQNATFEQRMAICHISKTLYLGLDRTGIDTMLSALAGRDDVSPYTKREAIAMTLMTDVFGPVGLDYHVRLTPTSAGKVICEIEDSARNTIMVGESETHALAIVAALANAMHEALVEISTIAKI